MSSKQWGIAVTTAALFLVVGFFVLVTSNSARRAAEESTQRALFVEAVELLEESHAINGNYPDSLDLLPFTYPDGGDRSSLALLQYESDGKSYSLMTKGVSSGQENRESR